MTFYEHLITEQCFADAKLLIETKTGEIQMFKAIEAVYQDGACKSAINNFFPFKFPFHRTKHNVQQSSRNIHEQKLRMSL